ncbi:MAG: DUF4339 domain-containing protein [Planctomycetales bacterium]
MIPRAASAPPRRSQKKKSSSAFYIHAGDGQEFGPISKKELRQWVAEGRIDAECQILQDGWQEWKWASECFPSLAPAAQESSDPFDFSQPSSGRSSGHSSPSSYRRKSSAQWKWSYSYWVGIMYGPIPVGWIIAAVIGLVVITIKIAQELS